MAIYLKFGNIKGTATAEGFTGQIALNTFRFTVSRQVTMEAGNLANREYTKPALSAITITLDADSSITALLKEALAGSAGQEAILSFVQTGDKLQEYLSYKLSNCIVSHYDISADKDGAASVILQLSYSALETSYKDRDASNKTGNPQRLAYDVKAAKLS